MRVVCKVEEMHSLVSHCCCCCCCCFGWFRGEVVSPENLHSHTCTPHTGVLRKHIFIWEQHSRDRPKFKVRARIEWEATSREL